MKANEIDVSKVGNKNLKGILGNVIVDSGEFVFWGKGKHHNDNDYREHDDSACYDHHTDEHNEYHTDHADHTDHKDRSHVDRSYSEGRYHTDSEGGHSDYYRNSHTDRKGN